MTKRQIIDLYRFQLVPTSGEPQLKLFRDRSPKTPEEAKERKNEYFAISLRELQPLIHRGKTLARREISVSDEFIAFRLGVRKDVERVTRDLEPERIESYPNVLVGIENTPDTQLIGISRNHKAFSSTSVPLGLLERTLNNALREFSLAIHIEALFESSEFWSIADRHRTRIQSVKFELVTPNMANISQALKIDLSGLNKASNSHRTNLELNSPTEGALELDPKNVALNSLVDYASEGGGDISIKIRGMTKRIRTSRSIRTIEVDDFEATGSPESTAAMLREFLKAQ
jgi:hypothetical protein